MRKILLTMLLAICTLGISAQSANKNEATIVNNIQYKSNKYAPLFHVRKDAAPLILITGDRNIELFGRYEENAYMWRMMNLVGRPDTKLYEIAGHGHGAMGNPAYHILIQSINKILGKKYEF